MHILPGKFLAMYAVVQLCLASNLKLHIVDFFSGDAFCCLKNKKGNWTDNSN